MSMTISINDCIQSLTSDQMGFLVEGLMEATEAILEEESTINLTQAPIVAWRDPDTLELEALGLIRFDTNEEETAFLNQQGVCVAMILKNQNCPECTLRVEAEEGEDISKTEQTLVAN